jgi:hypothetical protein
MCQNRKCDKNVFTCSQLYFDALVSFEQFLYAKVKSSPPQQIGAPSRTAQVELDVAEPLKSGSWQLLPMK